jgi:hypothetical protein
MHECALLCLRRDIGIYLFIRTPGETFLNVKDSAEIRSRVSSIPKPVW